MISATKAQDYERMVNNNHTLNLDNCDSIMGNDAFLINRMKISNQIRQSQNPLDAAQNIKGYDAQGNKILINQEAIQSGYLSDQGVNFEMIGSQKKSINRMFERQFENQAVFLNQGYNPHINQMRPADPRDENMREKDELKNSYPTSKQIFQSDNNNWNQQQQKQQQHQLQNPQQNIPPQTCPKCKSMKHIPFLPDGGSVLICQNCQTTFNNIYYNSNNQNNGGSSSPWFSDKFKYNGERQQEKEQGPQYTPVKRVQTRQTQSVEVNQVQKLGMRGSGNYVQDDKPLDSYNMNNYANYANNQLNQYRAKFNLDH